MARSAKRGLASSPSRRFREMSAQLAALGGEFHRRGWVLGTSGNFSAVVARQPLRLAITASGRDKGALAPGHFLELDSAARVLRGAGTPSAEAAIHLAIVARRSAGAVLHTHSVWSTILSEAHARSGGLALEGFEMLKGLRGVTTHEHREWLPVLENSQDIATLARRVEKVLAEDGNAHAFLIRRHGLYTWGADVAEAKRHVEILEFLMEVAARERGLLGAPWR
jgi:methylthioribulose-1-phosphate dehydratase